MRNVNQKGRRLFHTEEELIWCSLYPRKKLEMVWRMFSPGSVLDLGCGVGRAAGFFLARGARVVGVDISAEARRRSLCRECIIIRDIRRPFDLRSSFDLVWSFEFVEHIAARYVATLVDNFIRHSNLIVMSAAGPGQTGIGHYNLRPSEYWIGIFKERGYMFLEAKTKQLRKARDENLDAEHMEGMRELLMQKGYSNRQAEDAFFRLNRQLDKNMLVFRKGMKI